MERSTFLREDYNPLLSKINNLNEEDKIIHNYKARFLNFVKNRLPHVNWKRVYSALEFAIIAHKNQKRQSGEPYVTHCISVASLIAELKLDTSSIIAALLHDVVEDTEYTIENIKEYFGEKEAELVDGVTKLDKICNLRKDVMQAENTRKLLLAISSDVRVLLIKLADRLHNMETLDEISDPNKRIRIAKETVEIYAPLAERIGLHWYKNMLYNLSLSTLNPTMYRIISEGLTALRKEHQTHIDGIIKILENLMDNYGISAKVSGREKSIYSIWKKIEKKQISMRQMQDIFAFRIITENVQDCYRALGAIHSSYKAVSQSFQDYISVPKSNGYMSIHTIIIGLINGKTEIQIRTMKMHEISEYGIAAHWCYKQLHSTKYNKTTNDWLQKLNEILNNSLTAKELLDNFKLDMHYDQVFCFTYTGRLVALPQNASVLDFAFMIHSDVGISCIGAKVNGREVDLSHRLENGDQVEIIKSETNTINESWLSIAVTGKAISIIRKFLRKERYNNILNSGKKIFAENLQNLGVVYSESELKYSLLEKLKKKTIKDLYFSIGNGDLKIEEIIKHIMYNNSILDKLNLVNLFRFIKMKLNQKFNKLGNYEHKIKILDTDYDHYSICISKCCEPLPGDKISALCKTKNIIEIHASDCTNLNLLLSQNIKSVEVQWNQEAQKNKMIKIKIETIKSVNTISHIFSKAALMSINIYSFKTLDSKKNNTFTLIIEVSIYSEKVFLDFIYELNLLKDIKMIERI